MIVKCFLVSQLIYAMQSIGLPEKVLIDVNTVLQVYMAEEILK